MRWLLPLFLLLLATVAVGAGAAEVTGEKLLEEGLAVLAKGDAHRALRLISMARPRLKAPERAILPLVRTHLDLHDLRRARSLLDEADRVAVNAEERQRLWRRWASAEIELARREGRTADRERLVAEWGPLGRVDVRELVAWLDPSAPPVDAGLLLRVARASAWAADEGRSREDHLTFLLEAGRRLVEAGRAKGAVELLEPLAADPASPPQVLLLYASARERLDRAVASLLERADGARAAGRGDEARRLLLEAAVLHPGSGEVKRRLVALHDRNAVDGAATTTASADSAAVPPTADSPGTFPRSVSHEPRSGEAHGPAAEPGRRREPSPSTGRAEATPRRPQAAPRGGTGETRPLSEAASGAEGGDEGRVRDPDVLYELALSYLESSTGGLADRFHALGLFWQVGLGHREALRHALAIVLLDFWPLWFFFLLALAFAWVLGRWGRGAGPTPIVATPPERETEGGGRLHPATGVFNAEFKRRLARLGTFVNRIKGLSSCQTVKEVHEALLEVCTRSFGCSECEVFVLVEGGRRLELTAAAPNAGHVGKSLPCVEENVIGYAALTQSLLTPESVARDPHATALQSRIPAGMVFALPVVVQGRCSCVVYLSRHRGEEGPEELSNLLPMVHVLASVASMAIKNAEAFELTMTKAQVAVRAAERREKLLSQVVAPQVARRILQGGSRGGLESQKRRLTVLFSDIRNFTTLSERLPPEEVVSLLNEYITRMTQAIFDHGGTLDKYWGDAIIAYYGAPEPMPDHAHQAVLTARRMLQVQRILNHRWRSEGRPSFEIGIGINTADVIWGAIGSDVQMSYTVIGDGVNLASRLQSNAAGGQILVSETTRQDVGDRIAFRTLDPIQVKGKSGLIPVWDVIEASGEAPEPSGD